MNYYEEIAWTHLIMRPWDTLVPFCGNMRVMSTACKPFLPTLPCCCLIFQAVLGRPMLTERFKSDTSRPIAATSVETKTDIALQDRSQSFPHKQKIWNLLQSAWLKLIYARWNEFSVIWALWNLSGSFSRELLKFEWPSWLGSQLKRVSPTKS